MDSLLKLSAIALIVVIIFYAFRWIAFKCIPNKENKNTKVTLIGYVYIFIITGALLVIFSLEYFAPFFNASIRYIAAIILAIVAIVVEKILNKYGILLVDRRNDKNV